MTSPVLTTNEILAFARLSRATVYRLMKSDQFPKPFKITERKNGWLRVEIEAWLASRSGVTA